MQGVVQSCITCGVQYTMHQSTWKSFRDASEMHWKSTEFNIQGHTLTMGSELYSKFNKVIIIKDQVRVMDTGWLDLL